MISPTWTGKTKWPLFKHPVSDKEKKKSEIVDVKLWLLKNMYAIAIIKDMIIVYTYDNEIPKKAEDFYELNYYMLKEKSYPFTTDKEFEKIFKRTDKRKKILEI